MGAPVGVLHFVGRSLLLVLLLLAWMVFGVLREGVVFHEQSPLHDHREA